jgi:hypothetical protein
LREAITPGMLFAPPVDVFATPVRVLPASLDSFAVSPDFFPVPLEASGGSPGVFVISLRAILTSLDAIPQWFDLPEAQEDLPAPGIPLSVSGSGLTHCRESQAGVRRGQSQTWRDISACWQGDSNAQRVLPPVHRFAMRAGEPSGGGGGG